MNRVVIRLGTMIAPDGRPFVSLSLEEPPIFGSPGIALGCSAADPEFQALNAAVLTPGSVTTAGQHLFEALSRHVEIGRHLLAALERDRCPVLVEIAAPVGAEELPWEVLCSPADSLGQVHYLGLDGRWALARAVQPRQAPPPIYQLTPPVRIAAVLSCLGLSAAAELEALQDAAQTANARRPGSVELLIVASEEDVVATLQQEIDEGPAAHTQVQMVPRDLDALQTLIGDFRPHLLHFFCHGSQANGPHIAVAVKDDWDRGGVDSSLHAWAADLQRFTRPADELPLLMVLNCCEGAAAGADSQSLALSLALDGAAPAVVGMREPLTAETANRFTAKLYSKLLAELTTRIEQADGSATPLDWAGLLADVRYALQTGGGAPGSAQSTEWTLPAVYVHPDGCPLRVPAPQSTPLGHIVTRGPALAPERTTDESTVTRGRGDHLDPRTADRAARREIQMLQEILAVLPPARAEGLKDEATQRIAELLEFLGVAQGAVSHARA